MTVIDRPPVSSGENVDPVQRFVFHDVDWETYEFLGRKLQDQHIFMTYFKGRLEIVTVGYKQGRIVSLISYMIKMLAEETKTPIISAGMVTLKRADLQVGVEPDSSFYLQNVQRMRGKAELDLSVDPPPDLAIEVEVTRRLAERQSIYEEMGVPEIWVWRNDRIETLIRRGAHYEPAGRSEAFSQLTLDEMSEFVAKGLASDDTAWSAMFRARVREASQAKKGE